MAKAFFVLHKTSYHTIMKIKPVSGGIMEDKINYFSNFKKITSTNKINIMQLLHVISIGIIFIFLSYKNYFLFHTTVEIFGAVISFGFFIVSTNTYKINENDFLKFLGIGYAFVGILDLIHAFSYDNMQIFTIASINMVAQFWEAARIFELATVLISTVFIYKKIRNANYLLIVFIYLAAFALLVLDVLYFKILPVYRTESNGLTQYKIITDYIVSLGFLISVIIFYKFRKVMDKSMFIYIEISLILKVIFQILFTMYVNDNDIPNIVGHVLKVLSFYFIYKGIVVNGLQRPFDNMINYLDMADSSLREKEEQRKYIENTIIQNELCYDLIIDQSCEGIIIHTDGKLIYANSTAVNIFGAKDVSDLIGRSVGEFSHEDYIVKLKKRYETVLEKKVCTPFYETKVLSLEGKIIYGEVCLNYITYKGKPSVLCILRDLSQQKQIYSLKNDIKAREKELNQSNEYNKILTEFFANISHELKTPLNIILGATQLLLQPTNEKLSSNYEERLKKYLGITKQNSYRLVRLVNNLIDTSKYDSGYLKLNMHNHDIVSIVEDITCSASEYVKYRGANIVFDTDTEEKVMAVDADKIERIILNLLSNSIKFTNTGGEIIVNLEDLGDYIRISVKDTGIGIAEDKIESIFNRFEQVDKTFTRNREGSGIGLSLVKTLVEMHGGTIEAKSKLGKGSEFIVELPSTLIEDSAVESECALTCDNKVEKIKIEFSDIYSYD